MRRVAALSLLALTALAASACGAATGGGPRAATTAPTPAPSAAKLVALAGRKAAAAGSARMRLRVETTGPDGSPLEVRGSGIFSFAGRKGMLHVRVPGLPGSQGTITEVLDGLTLYMRFPALARRLPGGKPWVRMDLLELGKRAGVDLEQLSGLGSSDPSQALAYLRAGSTSVTRLGSAIVAGAQTTHIRIVVDLRKLAAAAPPATRASLRRTEKLTGRRTFPAEVWIGADGLLRRERFPAPDTTGAGGGSVTMDLFDYGAPVHVTAPPASQTVDLLDLLDAARGA
jgi:hypothetical protein